MCNLKDILRNPISNVIRNTNYGLVVLLLLVEVTFACGPGRGIGYKRQRKLTPLVFKEHSPNMPESTYGASRPNEGAISRESPNFTNLVPNYNNDIVFKDDEGTGADRLMSQRCKEKLNNLAISVLNEWPSLKLRVIESWDEDLHHGEHSLHYEGRAVDITTSDRDRAKNGMLARLAVESGFDWVYYESKNFIHCSVKPDSASYRVSGCFSGDSTVTTSTGETRRMSELEVGEKVLTMTSTGETKYSEVILFMDRNTTKTEEFVRIETDGGATLTVTPAHLILVWNPTKNLLDYVFADKVQLNDFVLVTVNGSLEPRKVTSLSVALSKGIYAPLTTEGTIVVNSVAASCYAVISSQSIAHWSLLPMRIANSVSSWFSSSNEIPHGSRNSIDQGVHWYAKTLYKIKDFIVPTDLLYH